MVDRRGESRSERIEFLKKQVQHEYRMAVSVDCVIFGYDENHLKVLLISSDMPQFEGQLSLLGDLVHPDVDLDSAVMQMLYERTGLRDLYIEQVGTFGKIDRHPLDRVLTVAYFALINVNDFDASVQHDPQPEWFTIGEVTDMAFDHDRILSTCLRRLQLRLLESSIVFKFLPQKFTLKQLQHLYEIVFDVKLDKRNFRRKMKSFGFLKPLDEIQKEVNHRPAQLFSFDEAKYLALQKKRFLLNF